MLLGNEHGFRQVLGCVATLLLGLGARAVAQTATVSGVVSVTVGTGVPGVEVRDSLSGRGTTTDPNGRYELELEPGRRLLMIEGDAIQWVVIEVDLKPGERRVLPIQVRPRIQELPELEVTVRATKPAEYASTSRYDDFFLRRSMGKGRFFTREEIRAKATSNPIEILRGISGIRSRIGLPGVAGGGQSRVEFVRCSGPLAMSRVQVWVDGFMTTSGQSFGTPAVAAEYVAETLEQIALSDIELIEVYTSQSQLPGDFLRDACAAIVIWTR